MRSAWLALLLPVSLLAGCGPDGATYCDPCVSVPVDAGPPEAHVVPMLVRAETGKTLTATPGEGAGVFVEYAAGGHWTVWWTCDSKKTGRTCDYVIHATARSGNIDHVAGYDGTTLTPPEAGAAEGGSPDAGSPDFDIAGRVTKDLQGVTFDTDPGAILEIDATLDGRSDGSLFYFVEGGKVKDGYKGYLSDPLDFEPTSP